MQLEFGGESRSPYSCLLSFHSMLSSVSHSGSGLTSIVVPGCTGGLRKADCMSDMLWFLSCASVSSILSVVAAGVAA
eukprot:5625609-Amphidinium_carterae.1